jgi:hypothetical protein
MASDSGFDGIRLDQSFRPGAREAAVAFAIALAASLLPFHRAVGRPFALDDYTFLLQAAGIDPAPFTLRRWLSTRAYYEMMLGLFGPRPVPWHLIAFLLHASLASGVWAMARRLGVSRTAAWTACGLFAASPVAVTAVYWIACIQEIGAGLWLVAAAWMVGSPGRWRWTAVPLFVLAMLCKESVLAAPVALLFIYGRRITRPAAAMLLAGAAVFVASGLQARMFASDAALPYATAYDSTLAVHLATQFVWLVAGWRAYPDRVAAPDPHLVPLALALLAVAFIAVRAWGRGARRPALAAAVWFVALLLPVLPLRQHAYAYYSYLPQMGLLILIAAGADQLCRRWRPQATELRLVAGVTLVAVSVLCAARSARTHESLLLPKSLVIHDSVLRAGACAGAIVRAVHDAHLSPTVHRVAFMSFPEELGTSAPTPGSNSALPNQVRVRKFPLRDSLRGGKLIALHYPGLAAAWVDTLTAQDEQPDTALFFTSGFDDVALVEDVPRAYLLQAQGQLMAGDRDAAVRSLQRAIAIAPAHPAARVLLAGLELEAAHVDVARDLVRGVDASVLTPDIRPLLKQVQDYLTTGTQFPDSAAALRAN